MSYSGFRKSLKRTDALKGEIDTAVAQHKNKMRAAVGIHGFDSPQHKEAVAKYKEAFDAHPKAAEYHKMVKDSLHEATEEEKKPIEVKKGGFHKWLGKSEDEPITQADIEKGLASDDEHVKKMAQFAKNAKSWK